MKTLDDAETGIFHAINKTSIDLFAYFDGLLAEKKFDINTYEWLLLTHILKQPGKSQKWYGDNILRDKTFVMRLVDSLEKKQLLGRKPDGKDRRRNLLYGTKAGERLIRRTLPYIREDYRFLFSDIDEKRLSITISVLQNLMAKIAKKSKDDAVQG
ncbi:MAG: winged helix-turn-helix transcriptional regulator [Anaerolineales bacterium]|nr:winged helix-turn-helix transcriptional regulator [Anaerolineales bacterium]